MNRRLLLCLPLLIAAASCAKTEPRTPRQPIVSIKLDPENPSVAVGGTVKITAQGVKWDGSTVDLEQVEWTSADPTAINLEPLKSVVTVHGLKLGAVELTATASGRSATTTVTVTAAVPEKLVVNPAEAETRVGFPVQLTAIATLTDGTTRDVTQECAWSTGDEAIASAESAPTQLGKITGRKAGATGATARLGALTASARISVTGASVLRIDLNPPRATIPLGTSVPFAAIAVFSDDTTSDVTEQATWTSSNPTAVRVATTTPRGVAEGLAGGDALITATFGAKQGLASATVTLVKLKAIEVAPARVQLAKGTSQQLRATAVFVDDTRLDVTAQAKWTSGSPSVVTLSATVKGAITGAAAGSAQVSAELLGFTGSAQITVTAATLDAIVVTPAAVTLPKGSSAQLTATGTYSDQTSQDITALVTWASSDELVAQTSNVPASRGQVQAIKPGLVTVSASLDGQSGKASVSVSAAALRSLAIVPAAPTIQLKTGIQLVTIATFTDGSTLDVRDQSAWSSADNTVVSVSTVGATGRGLASAVSPGIAVITGAYGGMTAQARVTVAAATLVGLTISPLDPSIAKGTTLKMQATGKYSDGTTQDVTTLVTWSVGDAATASVSNAAGSNGLVGANSPGVTSLSATLSGQSVKTTLTVTAALLVSFKVNPTAVTLDYKGVQPITATATYSDGAVVNVTDQAAWQSADPSIASVGSAAAPRGIVSAGREGKTQITASFGGKLATVDVAVKAPAIVKLEIRPGQLSLAAGLQSQLAAVATLADGTQQDVSTKVGWTSAQGHVSIGNGAAGGKLAALTQGTDTVTASLGQLAATAQITVTPPLPESLTISPSAIRLAAGLKQAFTVRAFFTDGSSQDVTAQTNFTSADTSVVGMTASTAVAVKQGGPIAITARFNGLSAQAQVTVTAPVLVSITLSTNGLILQKGSTAQIRATGVYSDGSTRDVTAEAGWSSTNVAAVTVSSGSVNAISPGSGTITASLDGVATSVTVTVQAPKLDKVVISPPNAVLRPNLIYPYKSYALYSDASTKDVTTAALWTSANPSIAEPINFQGYFGIWAKGVGTTTVKSTADMVTGDTLVNVSNATLIEVQVSPAKANLPLGVAVKLAGVFAYSDGWAVEIQNPTWSSQSPGTARVDTNGVVTALAQGNATIVMSANSPSGQNFQAFATINVTAAKIQSIAIKSPSSMVVGLAQRVTATGTFSDGSIVDLGPSPLWSTSDASLASIVPDVDSAKVTAKGAGQVKLTASFDGVAQSIPLTLTAATLSSLTVSAPQTTLPYGSTSTITATGLFSDGTQLDLTDSVVWDSTDPSVATVSNGVYTNATVQYLIGQSLGSASVRATLSGKSALLPVKVTGATLSSIALAVGTGPTTAALSVPKNQNSQLRAVGTFSDGSTADITVFCTYSPAKLAPGVVATISNVVMGVVTPLSVGIEKVVVTYAPSYIGQPTVTGIATLTVQ